MGVLFYLSRGLFRFSNHSFTLHFTQLSVHGGLGIKQNKATMTSTKSVHCPISSKAVLLSSLGWYGVWKAMVYFPKLPLPMTRAYTHSAH